MSRPGWPARIAAALVLAGAAACGSQDGSELVAVPAPSASPTVAEPTATAPSASPAVAEPTATAPTSSAPDDEPSVSAPASAVSVPSTSVPAVIVPAVSVPSVSVPLTSVPAVIVPAVSVPSVSVPLTSVPAAIVPTASLPIAPENDAGYDRDSWGPHNSDLCRGAVGSPDPYTGTPIDTCNVDHVVALHEAHESGGWGLDRKHEAALQPTPGQSRGVTGLCEPVQGR